MPCDDVDAIGVRLSELRLVRPRQWVACCLALQMWQELELDVFWRPRLRASREGTPWLKVLKTLVAYRLIDPGSEWRLHRQWFDASAMADLLDSDFALVEKNTLYRCLELAWLRRFASQERAAGRMLPREDAAVCDANCHVPRFKSITRHREIQRGSDSFRRAALEE